MGDDDSQKLLPWRGISLLSGAQTSGSQQNQHQHCTGKLGRISVGGRRLAQLHTAWIILGKYTWINSAKRRRVFSPMAELVKKPAAARTLDATFNGVPGISIGGYRGDLPSQSVP